MKKTFVIVIAVLAIGMALPSCTNQDTAPTQAVTLAPEESEAPKDTATATTSFTQIPTDTPLPTGTDTPTATFTSTFTPTFTFTPEPVYNEPGFYIVGGCTTFEVPNLAPPLTIKFCVTSVEVMPDYYLVFNVEWTIVETEKGYAVKRSDENNSNMYLRDNLERRYDHIRVGGDAARTVRINVGNSASGWFMFPPAQENATSFSFIDNDNGIGIGGITLFAGYKAPPPISMELTLYPLTWDYYEEKWELGVSEEGGRQLTHLGIPNCTLIEWQPSEPQGSLKNTLDLGDITYQIYGFLEPDWGVREYVAIAGIEGLDPAIVPIFRAIITYEESLACIGEVSEVLASLKLIDQ